MNETAKLTKIASDQIICLASDSKGATSPNNNKIDKGVMTFQPHSHGLLRVRADDELPKVGIRSRELFEECQPMKTHFD